MKKLHENFISLNALNARSERSQTVSCIHTSQSEIVGRKVKQARE